jgi:O-methyltransferase involved in polyketide biosynthesis
VSAGFDAGAPNVARVHERLLGGKEHFAADRDQAGRLLALYPPMRDMARENRAFLARAITWAAGQGTSQFLDLGCGLPAPPNTHQVARAVIPAARVAYVDTDPVVLSHARALLATSDGLAAAAADLTDPEAVLAAPELRTVIDRARPVAVILGAVLHFLDAGTARQVTAGYAQLMAPGSCLIISVACVDDQALGQQLAAEYTAGRFVNHARADIASFFAGLDMVGPGLAEAQTWRPWMSAPVLSRRTGHVLAGIARRPA